MFVGNEDASHPLGRAANGQQALAYLSPAQSRVDEEASLVGFQERAVSIGTAAKYRQSNGHSRS
jgi:hypothetical protein